MNKPDLQKNFTALRSYALSTPATSIYKKLKASFLYPKNRLDTHMEYIWRIILEAHDRLENNAHLLYQVPTTFTPVDVLKAQNDIRCLEKIISDPINVTQKHWKHVQRLPRILEKMLAPYLDQAAAYNVQMTQMDAETTDIKASFVAACRNSDYRALAKLYPYLDSVLEIDDRNATPESLQGLASPDEWRENEREKSLRNLFTDIGGLTPEIVTFWFGQPQIGASYEAKSGLRHEQRRSLQIWKDGQGLIAKLYDLTQKPKVSNDYVTDLILRDAAP